MERVWLTRAEFEDFRDVQIKSRTDWPATFSCNERGEVWPFNGYGLTYDANRLYLQGESEILDSLVEKVLGIRPEGGRFFLDDQGVFLGPPDERKQILRFVIL